MELPIRLLLVVVVLSFTIAMGYNAIDAHLSFEEEAAAVQSISEISLKTNMVGLGGYGMREVATFEIKRGSTLFLRNEDFNGTVNGIVVVELSGGGCLLKVISSPIWDSTEPPSNILDFLELNKVFQSGSHRMMVTHLGFSEKSNKSGYDYLLVK